MYNSSINYSKTSFAERRAAEKALKEAGSYRTDEEIDALDSELANEAVPVPVRLARYRSIRDLSSRAQYRLTFRVQSLERRDTSHLDPNDTAAASILAVRPFDNPHDATPAEPLVNGAVYGIYRTNAGRRSFASFIHFEAATAETPAHFSSGAGIVSGAEMAKQIEAGAILQRVPSEEETRADRIAKSAYLQHKEKAARLRGR